MSTLKNFYGKVMAVWAIIVFVITMMPVFLMLWVIILIKEPKRSYFFKAITSIWMRVFFFLTGCSLYRKGKENFIKGKNYIVICNHNSYMDVPVVTPFIPGAPNKTIAKVEMAKTPLFGLIYRRGAVLVDRSDKNSRKDSLGKMKKVLEMGLHMCIYPEGTRNKTEMPLKEFHDGAFRLAIATGKEIIPALLFNTKKALDSTKGFSFFPCRLEMHFLPPLSLSPADDIVTAKEKIHSLMSAYYVAHTRNR